MKIQNLIAGAAVMVALASAAHASGNVNDHLAAFQAGVHGVYNRSAIADVGNPDARYHMAKMDTEAMDCSQMPCCKHMNMTGKAKEDCMSMSKETCLKMLKPRS